MNGLTIKVGAVALLLLGASFTLTRSSEHTTFEANRTCEYSFYVKCKGSNQFVETVRAKDAAVAKTMVKNRYSDCTIQTKDANGKNCE